MYHRVRHHRLRHVAVEHNHQMRVHLGPVLPRHFDHGLQRPTFQVFVQDVNLGGARHNHRELRQQARQAGQQAAQQRQRRAGRAGEQTDTIEMSTSKCITRAEQRAGNVMSLLNRLSRSPPSSFYLCPAPCPLLLISACCRLFLAVLRSPPSCACLIYTDCVSCIPRLLRATALLPHALPCSTCMLSTVT